MIPNDHFLKPLPLPSGYHLQSPTLTEGVCRLPVLLAKATVPRQSQ